MKIEVYINSQKSDTKEYGRPVLIEEVIEDMQMELPYDILTARINGHRAPLTDVLREDCSLDLIDFRDSWGRSVYRASLSFLYIKAVHDVLGQHVHVKLSNTLSEGIFSTLSQELEEGQDKLIEKRMFELVDEGLDINQDILGRKKLLEYLHQTNQADLLEMVEYTPDLQMALLSKMGEEEQIFYTYMVPNTSYLKYFEIRPYKQGLLVRYSHSSNPCQIQKFEEEPLLYSALCDSRRWSEITGVSYAYDLNKAVMKNKYLDLILLSEAFHAQRIADIAKDIFNKKKRIILIAGPSSSGKTTFAKRLCVQLQVFGMKPLYLGTDDYFKDEADTPLGKDGKPDFESISALDVELFETQINDLLDGKKVDIPTFDFISGKKVFGDRQVQIDESRPVVIEGLHCLNPALTQNIDADQKYSIYISPIMQTNIDEHNKVPVADARMLRRIARDARSRGRSAAATIALWNKVRSGEEVNIFPYCDYADAYFNSHCLYEAALFKSLVKPLLEEITEDMDEYPEARRMLHFLQFFVELDDDSAVPNSSVIREFIGGSVFESLD